MRADRLRGHLEAMLLAVVAERPGHGYALIRRLRDRSGGTFDLPEGTVYPVLHRLERQGLVRSVWSEGERRRRRTYRISEKGRSMLEQRTREWEDFSRAVTAVLKGA